MSENKLLVELKDKIHETNDGRLEMAERFHETLKGKKISTELRNELEPVARYLDSVLSDQLDDTYFLVEDRIAVKELEDEAAKQKALEEAAAKEIALEDLAAEAEGIPAGYPNALMAWIEETEGAMVSPL